MTPHKQDKRWGERIGDLTRDVVDCVVDAVNWARPV